MSFLTFYNALQLIVRYTKYIFYFNSTDTDLTPRLPGLLLAGLKRLIGELDRPRYLLQNPRGFLRTSRSHPSPTPGTDC